MTNWEIHQAAFTSQSVGNTTVYGSVFDHLRVVDIHAMQVEVSAYSGDAALNVIFKGSLDGENWYELTGSDGTGTGSWNLLQPSASVAARYTQVIAGTNDSGTTATITVTVVSGISE
jgi:hypothetical protein